MEPKLENGLTLEQAKHVMHFQDTIGKCQNAAVGSVHADGHWTKISDIAKMIDSDEDYFRCKREPEEVRAMVFADFVYADVNRFDREWVYNYTKNLRYNDRRLLISCFMDTLDTFVNKYRLIYNVRRVGDNSKSMFEITNILLILVQVCGVMTKASEDAGDHEAVATIKYSVTLKTVSKLFRYVTDPNDKMYGNVRFVLQRI